MAPGDRRGLLWVAGTAGPDRQDVVCRSRSEAVLVDVAVLQGRGPVTGLAVADFTITDNGVPQTIADVSLDEMPLDLLPLVDVSDSMGALAIDRVRADASEIAGLARPDDRLHFLRVASAVREVPTVADLFVPLPFEQRHTALTDALAAALMRVPDPGRRRVVIVLTDGLDSISFLPHATSASIAARSDATVHIVRVGRRWGQLVTGYERFSDDAGFLQDLVDRSGGQFVDLVERPQDELSPILRSLVAEFRLRYLLRYTPQGVTPAGWHELTVKVVRPGKYDVRERKGYSGG